MTENKRSKNSRMRGSKTHGGGSMKKRRGAGHRGGRGAAGSGKRGDAKKPSIWRNKKYAGKYGFTSHSTTQQAPITLKHLEDHFKTLVAEGMITTTNDTCTVDLSKAGYTKLLGTGQATKKWNITVASATPSVIEKIKNAGGNVTLTTKSTNQKTDTQDSDNAK